MDTDFLTWLSSFLNFVILVYVSISLVETACFNLSQLIITAIGLFSSILIQLVSIVNK